MTTFVTVVLSSGAFYQPYHWTPPTGRPLIGADWAGCASSARALSMLTGGAFFTTTFQSSQSKLQDPGSNKRGKAKPQPCECPASPGKQTPKLPKLEAALAFHLAPLVRLLPSPKRLTLRIDTTCTPNQRLKIKMADCSSEPALIAAHDEV